MDERGLQSNKPQKEVRVGRKQLIEIKDGLDGRWRRTNGMFPTRGFLNDNTCYDFVVLDQDSTPANASSWRYSGWKKANNGTARSASLRGFFARCVWNDWYWRQLGNP
jgi:hypothetical protein